ncbi:MAG: c-type cytochrome [Proteobacteria bacterium]|nr:c-type cytochrome [Pseudomonadota bacterium]
MTFRIALVAILAMTAAACGSPKDDAAGGSPSPSAPDNSAAATAASATAAGAAPAAFAQCAACHSTQPGVMGVGPSLAGVYGTRSGEIAGYAFSDAMKNAKLTWDDKTLDAYLTSPMKLVPGTKMTFAGMSDPAARKDVIAYLKTLK